MRMKTVLGSHSFVWSASIGKKTSTRQITQWVRWAGSGNQAETRHDENAVNWLDVTERNAAEQLNS